MHSNDSNQIRNGLTNYIGALINASKFEARATKQTVSSYLIEEVFKLAETENKEIDLYVLKPFIRGIVHVLKIRIQELKKFNTKEVKAKIDEYNSIIASLEDFIKKIE